MNLSPLTKEVLAMARNVLIIEDNEEISDLITMHLTDLDCQVTCSKDGLDGLNIAQSRDFDLIILDIMLPTLDGIQVCQKIRSSEVYTPIMMLTAKSSEIDRVLGLEVGADDYLSKPFSIREFLARVKALFRRVDMFTIPKIQKEHVISIDNLLINMEKRTTHVRDKQLDLTAKEFDLLTHFAENPGRVFTRAQLLDQVWGYGHDGYEHTVNSHINRLRGKIEEDATHPKFIMTVWGVGYKFNPELEHN